MNRSTVYITIACAEVISSATALYPVNASDGFEFIHPHVAPHHAPPSLTAVSEQKGERCVHDSSSAIFTCYTFFLPISRVIFSTRTLSNVFWAGRVRERHSSFGGAFGEYLVYVYHKSIGGLSIRISYIGDGHAHQMFIGHILRERQSLAGRSGLSILFNQYSRV